MELACITEHNGQPCNCVPETIKGSEPKEVGLMDQPTAQDIVLHHIEPKNKPGRPKGFDGTRSRMPSALAQAFKANGLDWRADFAAAIKANRRDRIKLWLRLLPYMITTTKRAKVGRWKGRPSRAARIALEAMEQDL
jgi:hypothetical protein